MAYKKTTTLVVRQVPRPRGLSGWLDDVWGDITGAGSAGVTAYNTAEQQQGALALQQQQLALAAAGPSTGEILLIGGAALALLLIVKKKKAAKAA
jgi:hypothetical protein